MRFSVNRSVLISLGLAVTAFLWVMSGVIADRSYAAKHSTLQTDEAQDAPVMKVQVQDFAAQPMTREIHLQGVIEPVRQVDLRVEVSGRVTEVLNPKGSRLGNGEVLVELDLGDRLARLERARAELELQQAEHEASIKLQKQNLISDNRYKQSLAELAAARATVKEIEVELRNTRIAAPFAGVVNALDVELGSYLVPGDKVGTVVDDSAVLITTEVPQQHINKMRLGMRVSAVLLDDQRVSGEISFLSSDANPDTRTYRLEARVPNTNALRFFGQSATVSVELDEVPAHRISPTLLDLSIDGEVQVKAVDEHNQVQVIPVDILESGTDTIWVSGLPENIRLITIGQGFVINGQTVTPIWAKQEG